MPSIQKIKHYTYKFLFEKIFDQVRVNPEIQVKFINLNTTVKIAIKRNIDPSLPTRMFQRIYVCLKALKLGFRACRRELLGLDGAFMKGPFPGQVLAAIGLDSNNGIYPLAYTLVEAKSKISWCWFLQCLGDDIDVHPNSNFTFISDRQKQRWCGQAYKDLLWRSAFAISVKEFEKCILDLKKMNPKALTRTCSCRKWELTGIPCKHAIAACWNMALNDRATPLPEAYVNPCYWLTTWREIYSHKVEPINGTNYWEKSTCPTTLFHQSIMSR
ncbi:mutator type transposase [Tanacetum coccineum]